MVHIAANSALTASRPVRTPAYTDPSAMAQAPFVHLHVHSEYSILDGACRVPDLVARAAELEMPSVSLTDHGSMAGAVQLWKTTRGTGVKPVIGCEVYVAANRKAHEKGNAHLTLLAADNTGYSNLIKLSSLGYLEGYYYKPRVDWELLSSAHPRADRALRLPLGPRLQGARGEPRHRRRGRARPPDADVREATTSTSSCRTRTSTCRRASCRSSSSLADKLGLPTVATGDVHYLRDTDARAHEALLCIQSGDSLKNPDHWKFETDHFYFKSPEEMLLDFPGQEDAMRRTLEVAERCNVEIELGRILLPKLRRARGPRRVRLPRRAVRAGAAAPLRQDHARADRAAQVRADDDQGDGVHRLLPDRLGLHRLREAERRLRRAGPRLVRRLARRVLARDHRHRPDPLRPDVRAVPEPGPQVDARHRHRLRRRRPRARHQLRAREVRRRPRRADHHVLDHGRTRCRARRRPRARGALRRRRQDREADPGRPGPAARRLPRSRAASCARRSTATRSRRRSSTSRCRSKG